MVSAAADPSPARPRTRLGEGRVPLDPRPDRRGVEDRGGSSGRDGLPASWRKAADRPHVCAVLGGCKVMAFFSPALAPTQRGANNGAATFRLRKFADQPVLWPCVAGFNGAATFRLRKFRSPPPQRILLSGRFNEAATFRLRKCWNKELDALYWFIASMGPQPFGCGNSVFAKYIVRSLAWLQWGRNLSAAEISLCGGELTGLQGRFNGAATFRLRKWHASQVVARLRVILTISRGSCLASITTPSQTLLHL